jgi:hypothetical protein
MPRDPLDVEILYNDACPHLAETTREVERAVDALGLPRGEVRVRARRVASEEEARDLGFIGSPTVRVNGRRVEPVGAEARPRWLACREYVTEAGLRPYPSADGIAAALRAERGRG